MVYTVCFNVDTSRRMHQKCRLQLLLPGLVIPDAYRVVHGAGGDERFADADGQTGDDPRVKRVGQKLKVSLHTLIINTMHEQTSVQ